ncbi:replication protein A 70 kDa DNA-binding subunit C-like [Cryptomeria japonica]|uniref:replication protein A 70 kDa DNA-binding subunit C-like n=1 Tax=Cryptomeria japonica TaxID=3369 RepID=UPI0027DA36B7|nr:replication protein A 70 kDa DNA-binding subunit C-like [Cryptomeria japonica]
MNRGIQEREDVNTVMRKLLEESNMIKDNLRRVVDQLERRMARQSHSSFTPTSEVIQLTNNILVDIVGVVVYVGDVAIHRKDGSQTKKQIVKINDLSSFTIDINLWGPTSGQRGHDLKNMLSPDVVLILVVSNGRVGYFNRKVVNMTFATTLHINPPFPEAEPLMLRGSLPLHPHDFSSGFTHIDGRYNRMTIASIRERMSAILETIQTTMVDVIRFVNVTNDDFYYATCPLKVNGIDLIKRTTKELYMLQNDVSITLTPCVVINTVVSHRYMFTLLVCTDTYNFEPKLKVAINKVYEVDYIAECNALLVDIAHLSAQP